MSVTDQQILTEIQEHMVEPPDNGATWPSGYWTAAEVINYLNNRQNQFLKETAILVDRAQLVITPNVNRQPLPVGTMYVQRIVWRTSTNVYTELPRGDTFEADLSDRNWPYQMEPRPVMYMDGEIPTLQIQLAPASSDAGIAYALYMAIGTVLTGAGVTFTVPDEFVAAIKWGAVSDMLAKIGRAQDRGRAAWAEERYREHVETALMIIGGWEQ